MTAKLTDVELSRGYLRPYRVRYVHVGCGTVNVFGPRTAEVFAVDPKFYGRAYCAKCNEGFVTTEFVWHGTKERVGD